MKKQKTSVFLVAVGVLLLSSCGLNKSLKKYPALYTYQPDTALYLVQKTDSLRVLSSKDYMLRNGNGNWELYVSGNALQMGDKIGMLSRDLIHRQRKVFMNKLEEMVPSSFRRRLILRFVNWYNRRLDNYITEEYLSEIYALSRHLDHSYDYAGTPFYQVLYMHAAHDLGHALQDLAIVGCSSVASWGNKTDDGKLLIGRNFDFYLNDEFAENKVISFVRSEKGIPFASVSWPGMIGVVSGMNLAGLTVTMNAGKSSIPLSAKTPVSIIAREILEHASNIEEAIAIARKRAPFVSESLMIGSAYDNKAALIEISPKNFGVYEVQSQGQLVCTNHFQADEYKQDTRNTKHILDSHSQYRYDRLQELLKRDSILTPDNMVHILRDTKGLKDSDIGLGNDKSLTHLLAHHAVVFKPSEGLMWVSNGPYQLGEFHAYNLKDIFSDTSSSMISKRIETLTVPSDPFLTTNAYADYERYRMESVYIEQAIKDKVELGNEQVEKYKELNPSLWYVYYLSGKYYMQVKNYSDAVENFNTALKMEIPTRQTREYIEKLRVKADKKWKK